MEISETRARLDALRQQREAAGITRNALALRSGINPSYIAQVEDGFPNPSAEFMAKYEPALTGMIAEQDRC